MLKLMGKNIFTILFTNFFYLNLCLFNEQVGHFVGFGQALTHDIYFILFHTGEKLLLSDKLWT